MQTPALLQAWQTPVQALSQHTPSGAQNPDAHSPAAEHTTLSFFLHWDSLHSLLLSRQSVSFVQVKRHTPLLQLKSPQGLAMGVVHLRAPSQVEAGVAVFLSALHEAGGQAVSLAPLGKAAQTPFIPLVSLAAHDSQAPLQSELQQYPSTHLSEPQSALLPQPAPLAGPHCLVRVLHVFPLRQSASVEQLALQDEPLQTRSLWQVFPAGAEHFPAPSQVEAPISLELSAEQVAPAQITPVAWSAHLPAPSHVPVGPQGEFA